MYSSNKFPVAILAVALMAVLALPACGSSSSSSSATPGQTTTVASSITPAPSPTGAPSTQKANSSPSAEATAAATAASATAASATTAIQGFGATDDDWNMLHTEDTMKDPGSAYDRQPDGTDKFAVVVHSSGRVLGFEVQLPDPGIAASEAKSIVLSLLPSDAKVAYDVSVPGLPSPPCEIAQYQSATLAGVLSAPAIGDPQGLVDAVFSSASPVAYDSQHVDRISFLLGGGNDGFSC